MAKTSILTSAGRASAMSTPKLTKDERTYKRSLALVAMSPSKNAEKSREYKRAAAFIAHYEAYVPFNKTMISSNENSTSPRRKKVKTTDGGLRMLSSEKRVLSPSLMMNEASRVMSPDERGHQYPGLDKATAVFQTPPSTRLAKSNANSNNSNSNTIEFDLTQYGEEEEEDSFHKAQKMGSPALLLKSNGKEPKQLYFQSYPDKTDISNEWEVWKHLTWKYLKTNPCLLCSVAAVLFLFGSVVPWLFLIARLF